MMDLYFENHMHLTFYILLVTKKKAAPVLLYK